MANRNFTTSKGSFEENALKELHKNMKSVLEKLNEIEEKLNKMSTV